MLSEEEQAVENLEKLVKLRKNIRGEITHDTCICGTSDLDTGLKLINKLKKENHKNLISDVSRIAIELGLEEDGTIDEIYAKIKEKDKQIDLTTSSFYNRKMLNRDEKNLLKIFKAQVEKEETEYFSVNAYTQLLYDSHKTVLNLITELQKESEEKDKMINLMAKYIAKEDTTEEFCDYKTVCDQNCEECVVQHFKDKVTEK